MRWAVAAGQVLAMFAFATGVYHAVGYMKSGHMVVHKPNEVSAPALTGAMYLVQGGAIYRFKHGSFTQITPEAGWTQPSAAPRDQLVAVRRQGSYSDLYLLTRSGKSVAQLTRNSSNGPAENNHWAFYPRFSPDGQTLFYAYDPKDSFNSFRADLSIFASRMDQSSRAVPWTQPNEFTGGDIYPLPTHSGALIYTKFSINDSFEVHSQIWAQRRAGSAGVALTAPELGCGQPTLSPDEKMLAMVCAGGANQSAELDVATLDTTALTLGSPATLVSGQLLASPVFSPDGKTIAYLAPSVPGGQFQLWTVGTAAPASVRNVTTDLGLDSTSAPVWVGG